MSGIDNLVNQEDHSGLPTSLYQTLFFDPGPLRLVHASSRLLA